MAPLAREIAPARPVAAGTSDASQADADGAQSSDAGSTRAEAEGTGGQPHGGYCALIVFLLVILYFDTSVPLWNQVYKGSMDSGGEACIGLWEKVSAGLTYHDPPIEPLCSFEPDRAGTEANEAAINSFLACLRSWPTCSNIPTSELVKLATAPGFQIFGKSICDSPLLAKVTCSTPLRIATSAHSVGFDTSVRSIVNRESVLRRTWAELCPSRCGNCELPPFLPGDDSLAQLQDIGRHDVATEGVLVAASKEQLMWEPSSHHRLPPRQPLEKSTSESVVVHDRADGGEEEAEPPRKKVKTDEVKESREEKKRKRDLVAGAEAEVDGARTPLIPSSLSTQTLSSEASREREQFRDVSHAVRGGGLPKQSPAQLAEPGPREPSHEAEREGVSSEPEGEEAGRLPAITNVVEEPDVAAEAEGLIAGQPPDEAIAEHFFDAASEFEEEATQLQPKRAAATEEPGARAEPQQEEAAPQPEIATAVQEPDTAEEREREGDVGATAGVPAPQPPPDDDDIARLSESFSAVRITDRIDTRPSKSPSTMKTFWEAYVGNKAPATKDSVGVGGATSSGQAQLQQAGRDRRRSYFAETQSPDNQEPRVSSLAPRTAREPTAESSAPADAGREPHLQTPDERRLAEDGGVGRRMWPTSRQDKWAMLLKKKTSKKEDLTGTDEHEAGPRSSRPSSPAAPPKAINGERPATRIAGKSAEGARRSARVARRANEFEVVSGDEAGEPLKAPPVVGAAGEAHVLWPADDPAVEVAGRRLASAPERWLRLRRWPTGDWTAGLGGTFGVEMVHTSAEKVAPGQRFFDRDLQSPQCPWFLVEVAQAERSDFAWAGVESRICGKASSQPATCSTDPRCRWYEASEAPPFEQGAGCYFKTCRASHGGTCYRRKQHAYNKGAALAAQSVVCLVLYFGFNALAGGPTQMRGCFHVKESLRFSVVGILCGLSSVFAFTAQETLTPATYMIYAQLGVLMIPLMWRAGLRTKIPSLTWTHIGTVGFGIMMYFMADWGDGVFAHGDALWGIFYVVLKVTLTGVASMASQLCFRERSPIEEEPPFAVQCTYLVAWKAIACMASVVLLPPHRLPPADLRPRWVGQGWGFLSELNFLCDWNRWTVLVLLHGLGDTLLSPLSMSVFDSLVKNVCGVVGIVFPTFLVGFVAGWEKADIRRPEGQFRLCGVLVVFLGALAYVLGRAQFSELRIKSIEVAELRQEWEEVVNFRRGRRRKRGGDVEMRSFGAASFSTGAHSGVAGSGLSCGAGPGFGGSFGGRDPV